MEHMQVVDEPALVAAANLTDVPLVRRRGRPRDPEADIRILDAAADLILARGYDAMTVDDVASQARVGKATVYRRWSRKDDLALAAMERIYSAEIPIPDTGTLRGDLLAVYTSTLRFANSRRGAAYLRTTVTESVRDPRIAALHRNSHERAAAAGRLMYERAVLRGEIAPGIDLTWTHGWLGGILAMCVITGRPVPRVDEAESLVDQILLGVTRH